MQSEGLTGSSDPKILEQTLNEIEFCSQWTKGIADVRLFPPSAYTQGSFYFARRVQARRWESCDSFETLRLCCR